MYVQTKGTLATNSQILNNVQVKHVFCFIYSSSVTTLLSVAVDLEPITESLGVRQKYMLHLSNDAMSSPYHSEIASLNLSDETVTHDREL